MSLVTRFLDEFSTAISHGDVDQLMAMNMPDDLTGWGLFDSDDFNSPHSLRVQLQKRYKNLESACVRFELLDSFENDSATTIVCREIRDLHFKDGTRIKDDDLRFSLYLIRQGDELQIRHGHLSIPWPEQSPFPENPVPDRHLHDLPEQTVRLDTRDAADFIALLNQRETFTYATNLNGLLSQQHPSTENIFFPMRSPAMLRGNKEYQHFLEYLKENCVNPSLNYYQPVIFRNGSLACLSAYADAACQDKASGNTIRIRPLRVTYILQQHEGQWLSRHSHWSIPLPDSL